MPDIYCPAYLLCMEELKKILRPLIREVLEKKYTDAEKSWADMMIDLSKHIKKPIVRDSVGHYNVCECEPHHINIRPIVHNIFDCVYIKDGTDRNKILYIEYPELKKWIKEKLDDESNNYVDTAYQKNVENSKDKESSSKKESSDIKIVPTGIKDDGDKAKDMNKKEDDPTEEMKEVDKNIDKQLDKKSKNPNFKVPKLDRDQKKLVMKYGKKKTPKLK